MNIFANALVNCSTPKNPDTWIEFLTYGSMPQTVCISSVQRVSKSAEYTTMLYMNNGNVLEVNESYEDVLRKLGINKS